LRAGQPGEDGASHAAGTAGIAQVEQLTEDSASRMVLFGLDASSADHLAPSFGFVGDELATDAGADVTEQKLNEVSGGDGPTSTAGDGNGPPS
jgi:hypothetical protein